MDEKECKHKINPLTVQSVFKVSNSWSKLAFFLKWKMMCNFNWVGPSPRTWAIVLLDDKVQLGVDAVFIPNSSFPVQACLKALGKRSSAQCWRFNTADELEEYSKRVEQVLTDNCGLGARTSLFKKLTSSCMSNPIGHHSGVFGPEYVMKSIKALTLGDCRKLSEVLARMFFTDKSTEAEVIRTFPVHGDIPVLSMMMRQPHLWQKVALFALMDIVSATV
jgi:hypothetical protein